MTSLPGYTMLDMPELDTSSSDSSPSSGIASIEQHEYLSNTHQYPAYIPPSYQTGYYGYLSPPNTHTPSFGYSQPISPGFAHTPDLSTQVYQAYHYGYNCNYPLPTIPPRFSATAPVSVPGRATGCVSPLDLFGNMPKQRSLPTTGWGIGEAPSSLASTPSLEITVDMDEAGGSTSSLGDIDPVSPTPSVESDTCVDEAELEDNAQVEQEPQQRQEVTHGVKKQKKLLPAGGKVCLSPTMENKGEEGAVEGKEGKKRSRSAQACERCRVRKARCFGGHPCNRCIKRKFTCEFTPTKTKSVPKPEAAKPKIRRHSMHTVSSSMAPGPSIAQSDSRPGTHRAASHAHTRSVTIPNPSTHPYARPLAPAPPVYSASSSLPTPALPTSHIGLGLGLTLGLQLTPPPDDLDAGGDEVPEMSPSSTLYSSDPLVSGVATRWSTSAEPRTNETHAPTMLVEEDIFQFSPHQNASNLTVNGWIPGVDLDGFASNSDGYGSGDSQLDTIMGRSNHMMYGLTSDWGAHPMASRA